MRPSVVTKMFSGLRSRWKIPRSERRTACLDTIRLVIRKLCLWINYAISPYHKLSAPEPDCE